MLTASGDRGDVVEGGGVGARTGRWRTTTRHLNDETMTTRSLGGRAAGLLLIGVFLGVLSVASGHLYSIDGLQYFRVAERLLLDRSWVYDPPLMWGGPVRDPITPIGLSIAYLPALLASLPLVPFQPQFGSIPYDQVLLYGDPVYVASSWVNPLCAALVVLGTASLAAKMARLSRPVAVKVGLAALFGSPLLFYARADFPQVLSAALLVGMLLLVVRVRQGDPARRGLIFFAAVAAVLTRPVDGTIAIATALIVLMLPSKGWMRSHADRGAIGEVVAGAALGVAMTLAVNAARRGAFLDFGPAPAGFVGSIHLGLIAELWSPGRGLFWYLPLTGLALVAAFVMWKGRNRAALAVVGLPIVAYVLIYAKWLSLGAWSWGPRYLAPITPLVVILAATFLRKGASPRSQAAFWILAASGVLVNLAGIGVDQLQGFWGVFGDDTFGTPGFWNQFRPGAFAPVSSWANFTGTPDVIWFRLAPVTHGASLVPFALLAASATVLVLLALRITSRSQVQRPSPRR
jgi:hypothetical protein